MAKIVNSWNGWDPLKRVIVGRPEGTNVPAPEPAWQYDLPLAGYPLGSWGPFAQEYIDQANEQIDNFVSILKKRGIIVDRVKIQPFMFNKPVSTPDWTQSNCYGANNPRDLTLIHGNMIIDATCSRRSRYYEYLSLRPIFERYFQGDPEVIHIAAPRPRLTDDSYVRGYYRTYDGETLEQRIQKLQDWDFQLTEAEPLWDAADGMRFGKDIFHKGSAVTNRAGADWLKRLFDRLGIRFHSVLFGTDPHPDRSHDTHPWHIDTNIMPLRPGLCMVNPEYFPITAELFELFRLNDWELVHAVRPTYKNKNESLHKPFYCGGDGPTWNSINTLSIDPKTICVESHETAYCEQLDKLGFEVIPVPYEQVIAFGGSLHCSTLDVYREGALEDYFPKQIEGF